MLVTLAYRLTTSTGVHDPGSTVDLPDVEAAQLVRDGFARTAPQEEPTSPQEGDDEAQEAPEAPTKPKGTKRAPRRPTRHKE